MKLFFQTSKKQLPGRKSKTQKYKKALSSNWGSLEPRSC